MKPLLHLLTGCIGLLLTGLLVQTATRVARDDGMIESQSESVEGYQLQLPPPPPPVPPPEEVVYAESGWTQPEERMAEETMVLAWLLQFTYEPKRSSYNALMNVYWPHFDYIILIVPSPINESAIEIKAEHRSKIHYAQPCDNFYQLHSGRSVYGGNMVQCYLQGMEKLLSINRTRIDYIFASNDDAIFNVHQVKFLATTQQPVVNLGFKKRAPPLTTPPIDLGFWDAWKHKDDWLRCQKIIATFPKHLIERQLSRVGDQVVLAGADIFGLPGYLIGEFMFLAGKLGNKCFLEIAIAQTFMMMSETPKYGDLLIHDWVRNNESMYDGVGKVALGLSVAYHPLKLSKENCRRMFVQMCKGKCY